ncbi:MAG: response regulator [Candidatus Helarchaeota archaeon]
MLRILIVDDEEAIRSTLTWTLEKEGYKVDSSCDFESAKTAIEENDYDLYIIDIFLPGKNGLDLIKHIKTLGKEGLIIIISGYPNVPTLIDSMRLDAYDYIKKPFSLEYLKKVIKIILSLQDNLFGYDLEDEYLELQSEED